MQSNGSDSKSAADWRTKPTDRFILRWTKVHLSAHITPWVGRIPGMRPWLVTVLSGLVGVAAGTAFALGHPVVAGSVAAVAQVLDGVDGQLSRLTGRSTRSGALLDSCLDRYSDAAMVVGSAVFVARAGMLPLPALIAIGFGALVGSNLVSYSAARAESLSLDLGPPTLVSKGSRMSSMVVGALLAELWTGAPLVVLAGLALFANGAVVRRLVAAARQEA